MNQTDSTPLADDARILLAHGEGGRLARELIAERLKPVLGNRYLDNLGDAALLESLDGRAVMTTDSYVVSPRFFPGGDIGSLSVFGTVNDLLVSGARPRWLSLAFILEEGFSLSEFDRVLQSIATAARRADVAVVTGDTKVVPRGMADGMFINTTGLGELLPGFPPGPAHLVPGDELLVTGPLGQHGIAVLAAREALLFDPPPQSDCAPLTEAVAALREQRVPVRAMRDATRGGVAAVLHEWAACAGATLTVREADLPLSSQVRGICELLGIDPLHVANEGAMVVAIAGGEGERAIRALRQHAADGHASLVGQVLPRGVAPVTVVRSLGRQQPLDEPQGAPLPRIC